MELLLATLCDYTMVSQEGKLSILGIFERVFARQFPARHRRMELAMQIKCSLADIGHERDIQVVLIDQDGRQILQSVGSLNLPPDVAQPPTLNIIQVFEDVGFPEPGRYSFNVYLSGREVAAIPLELVQLPPEEGDDERDERPSVN